ncbi:MAG: methyltransferase domain-containing protein [Actinomycetota bacterium]|nr:methyltransferase domain-containing protein [Actinomycetota bacterium]
MTQRGRAVAEVFGRAAHTYGRVGQDFFGFFGRRIVAMTGETLGGSVLDVGCGAAAALVAASAAVEEGALVVGVDLSREMLLRAAEALAKSEAAVFVALADAERLPFPDGVFDAVVSSFALGYFPSPQRAVAEMRRVLKPRGKVGICVSDGWWFQGDPDWRWHEELLAELRAPVEGGPFRNPAAVVDLLTEAAFNVKDAVVETFPLEWKDADEWWDAGWSHGYRKVLEALSPSALQEYRTRSYERLKGTPVRGRLEVVLVTGEAVS